MAGPDSLDSAVWRTPEDSPGPLQVLIERLKSEYPIDPRRVYLFGHSGGAVQALRLAGMEASYFAAIALHAGALGAQDYWVLDLLPERVSVGIIVGSRDRFFPVQAVEATRDVMQEKGFEVTLEVMDGHGHDYYGRSEEINSWVWRFLKDRKMDKDPAYQEYEFPPGR